VNLKSRIIGGSAALALAVGMTAGPAFAVDPTPPTNRTGDAVWSGGEETSLGACNGVAIGTLATPDKANGLSNTVKRDITSSSKGISSTYGGTTVSSCLFTANRTDAESLLGNNTPTATKFGTKLHSASTSCAQQANDPSPNTNRPLAGQIQWGWSNGQKTQGYIRVAGFDKAALAAIWLRGIVAKGPLAGLSISGSVWFLPAVKAKLAATSSLGDPVVGAPELVNPLSAGSGDGVAVGGGYATSATYALVQAGGCKTGTGTVDLKTIAIGAAVTDPLFGAGDPTTGIHFLG